MYDFINRYARMSKMKKKKNVRVVVLCGAQEKQWIQHTTVYEGCTFELHWLFLGDWA